MLEPFDPIGEDLDRTAGLAPGQPDECDLEHESRIGGVGPAHVDDGLAERLEAAHEHRVAEHVADALEPLPLVLGRVDVHLAPRGHEQERVAQGSEEVFGDAAGVVPRLEERRQAGQRAGDVFGSDGVEDRDAGVEG